MLEIEDSPEEFVHVAGVTLPLPADSGSDVLFTAFSKRLVQFLESRNHELFVFGIDDGGRLIAAPEFDNRNVGLHYLTEQKMVSQIRDFFTVELCLQPPPYAPQGVDLTQEKVTEEIRQLEGRVLNTVRALFGAGLWSRFFQEAAIQNIIERAPRAYWKAENQKLMEWIRQNWVVAQEATSISRHMLRYETLRAELKKTGEFDAAARATLRILMRSWAGTQPLKQEKGPDTSDETKKM